MKKLFLLFLFSLLAGAIYAQRQDSLTRELTVVSDATIVVDKADPLNPGYIFDKPKVTRLKPTPPRPTRDFTPSITIPRHPALSDWATRLVKPQKYGYVSLLGGMGPLVSADAALFIPVTDDTRFFLDASHRSSLNRISVHPPLSSRTCRYATDLLLGLNHIDAASQWQIAAYFSHDRFSMHGTTKNLITTDALPELDASNTQPPLINEIIAGSKMSYCYDADQYLLDIEGTIEYAGKGSVYKHKYDWNPQNFNKQLSFDLKGKYTQRFADRFRVGLVADAVGVFDNSSLGEVMNRLIPDAQQDFSGFSAHSETATPFVGIEGMIGSLPWHVDLGASLGIYSLKTDDPRVVGLLSGSSFVWYPYLDAELAINRDCSIYAQVNGGMHRPNKFGDDLYNRYIALGETLLPERQQLHSELGINFNAGAGFEAKIAGGYDLFTNKNFLRAASGITVSQSIPFYIFFLRDEKVNVGRVFANVALKYHLHDKLEISTDVTFRKYLLKEGNPSGYIPLEVRGGFVYRPTEKWSFSTYLYSGMFARFYSSPMFVESLAEESNPLHTLFLTVGANYRLNSYVAFHALVGSPTFFPQEFPIGYADVYPIMHFNLGASVSF